MQHGSINPPLEKRANQVKVGDVLGLVGGPFEVHAVTEDADGSHQIVHNERRTHAWTIPSTAKVAVVGWFTPTVKR
jgi:hypothetical protein